MFILTFIFLLFLFLLVGLLKDEDLIDLFFKILVAVTVFGILLISGVLKI